MNLLEQAFAADIQTAVAKAEDNGLTLFDIWRMLIEAADSSMEERFPDSPENRRLLIDSFGRAASKRSNAEMRKPLKLRLLDL